MQPSSGLMTPQSLCIMWFPTLSLLQVLWKRFQGWVLCPVDWLKQGGRFRRRMNCDQVSWNIRSGWVTTTWLKVIWERMKSYTTFGDLIQSRGFWQQVSVVSRGRSWVNRKGMDDERAVGLKSVLRAAWFLRSSGVLLECVTGAGKDQQVRSLIQHWCDCTGFKASDINLSLADVWPSKRERWWCLLTSPLIPRIPLTPWPKVDDPPNSCFSVAGFSPMA